MQREKVVIVVPIYRANLTRGEYIALSQLQRELGRYPRVFVAPEGLAPDYGELGAGFTIEYFAPEYFSSTASYSELLLTPDFYARFSGYEYMLIYQLDAFVFADRLLDFCSRGYDYIGAPVYRFEPHWHAIGTNVGNGGFSLRRIDAALRILAQREEILAATPFSDVLVQAEDNFWGYCGASPAIDFRVPGQEEALGFAVQDNVAHIYQRFDTVRPFGCHAWDKFDFDFWRPIIERYGYDLAGATTSNIASSRYLFDQEYTVVRRYISLGRLYYSLRNNRPYGAIALISSYLDSYDSGSPVWYGMLVHFCVLWRLCQQRLAETRDSAYYQLEQLLQEALARIVHSGLDGMWKLDMLVKVYNRVASADRTRANMRLKQALETIVTSDLDSYELWDNIRQQLFYIDHGLDVDFRVARLLELTEQHSVPGDEFMRFVAEHTCHPQAVMQALIERV